MFDRVDLEQFEDRLSTLIRRGIPAAKPLPDSMVQLPNCPEEQNSMPSYLDIRDVGLKDQLDLDGKRAWVLVLRSDKTLAIAIKEFETSHSSLAALGTVISAGYICQRQDRNDDGYLEVLIHSDSYNTQLSDAKLMLLKPYFALQFRKAYRNEDIVFTMPHSDYVEEGDVRTASRNLFNRTATFENFSNNKIDLRCSVQMQFTDKELEPFLIAFKQVKNIPVPDSPSSSSTTRTSTVSTSSEDISLTVESSPPSPVIPKKKPFASGLFTSLELPEFGPATPTGELRLRQRLEMCVRELAEDKNIHPRKKELFKLCLKLFDNSSRTEPELLRFVISAAMVKATTGFLSFFKRENDLDKFIKILNNKKPVIFPEKVNTAYLLRYMAAHPDSFHSRKTFTLANLKIHFDSKLEGDQRAAEKSLVSTPTVR